VKDRCRSDAVAYGLMQPADGPSCQIVQMGSMSGLKRRESLRRQGQATQTIHEQQEYRGSSWLYQALDKGYIHVFVPCRMRPNSLWGT
jgi:hypothetical protein